MKRKCYFCDTNLEVVAFTLKLGLKEEPLCDECNLKTLNRQKANQENGSSS